MHDDLLDRPSWTIGLDSWVIQDGSYPDLVTGQRIDFAVEFASRGGLRQLDEAHEVAVHGIGGSQYEVTAQIVHDRPNAQVIDFGMLAYHFIGIADPEHQPHVGAWVTGVINLSVDPFFYFDELAHEEGFPALTYSWTVHEIQERTGTDALRDGASTVRADTGPGLVTVERTDAWGDVSKLPGYLLRCGMERKDRADRGP
ncbi:hypothetical protein KRR39_09620 [Nocardioides panacis]|uniref:Uncharacterized protein n=1 Tax=Nocardioides panacis TaxID=2849501 RepID=A0A975T1L9_9ACTN|nr:hypothetical protein [Nocardioides panacis]QWZ09955.1 hypothetical protein KRR39_09620 [Nocardioides panacis]